MCRPAWKARRAKARPATYLSGPKRKFFNAERIDKFYMPNAVADGDSIVHFRKPDVIVTATFSQQPAIPV